MKTRPVMRPEIEAEKEMQPPFDQYDPRQNQPAEPQGQTSWQPYPQGYRDYQGYQAQPGEPYPPFMNNGPAVPPTIPPAVNLGNNGYTPEPEKPEAEQPRVQTIHQRVDDMTFAPPSTEVETQRRSLRPGSVILMILLAVLLVVLFVSLFGSSCSGANYGYITQSELTQHSGDAIIVRNEMVYTQNGMTMIEYAVEEGQEVERGKQVCTVYTSGFSTSELTKLENYRTQIKNYHKQLLANETTADAKLNSLESVILARAVEMQALVQGARGNMINQEALLKEAMQNRQAYLKLKYPDDQKLTRYYEDENTQAQRISSWTKQFSAQRAGLVSFYTDGYETALNMNTWLDYDPQQVRSMLRKAPEDPNRARNAVDIYRLVGTDSWSVLMLADEKDWTPMEGQIYQLVIESFDNMVVQAKVVSFILSGGEMLVRLSILNPESSIENALYIRECRVSLGETSANSLCVPDSAVMQENGINYVAIWYEDWNSWARVEVNILGENKQDKTLTITPRNPGQLSVGMRVKLDW